MGNSRLQPLALGRHREQFARGFVGVCMTVRAGLAAAIAVWSLAAGGMAFGQDAPAFPESLSRESLLRWLQRETDIMPERVLAVTPQAVSSVVSTFPAGGGQGPRLVIRAEALSAETLMRTGALSWHVSLQADCQGRRLRLGETTGYPQRNLLGERMLLRVAETEWRRPEPGTALESAWRAACEPSFKGPFQASAVNVTRPDDPTPPPAPAQAANDLGVKDPAAASPPEIAPPPPRQVRTGGYVVQVGASPSEAEARGLLASVRDHAGGHETRIETAVIGGRTWRRAVVAGFGDAAEAGAFCNNLKASGRECFVRPAR
ncbi:SPOR domain-containing protein [Phenylobacterium sp.]|uniref:SPOR domain-containing protein n=1 Tax=Phenylobacterium sp. TaxID=1871053 RepID=UPI00301BF801